MSIRNNETFNWNLAELINQSDICGSSRQEIQKQIFNRTWTDFEIKEAVSNANGHEKRLESAKNQLIECIDNYISNSKEQSSEEELKK